jgi:tripartite ATP-independent transporter DctM subunit
MITEQSIGQLFMAGVLPGVLLTVMFMLTIYAIARRNPSMGPAGDRSSWGLRIGAFKDVWGVIILFILVMGGIWGGVFTPTEAAAVGALVSFLFVVTRGKLTINSLIPAFRDTVKTTGMIYVILIGAMIFGYFMTVSGLPMVLANFVGSLPLPPMGILVAILIVYIFLGCLLDALAMILITMPIFLPVLTTLGFDLIWFGVLSTLMSELALITPPIGMNVFVISGMVNDVPLHSIFKGILPFSFSMIICIAILVIFPQISLFLPNMMIAIK